MSTETIDLFDVFDSLTKRIRKIFYSFDESKCSYKELARIHFEVEKLGYTFDFYLDANPYNLRKI